MRLGRRGWVLRLSATGVASALAACQETAPQAGHGWAGDPIGMVDADPGDPPGAGRGGTRRARPGALTGPTDEDPADPVHDGQGPRRALGSRPATLMREPAPPDLRPEPAAGAAVPDTIRR
ncbi:MAG TPA: hypothetical protein VD970_10430 [Acetobacteraceae bacterium]|nr:hypothetical protein [Acetobacteraceae bacterium]